jgi:hypothetical protein
MVTKWSSFKKLGVNSHQNSHKTSSLGKASQGQIHYLIRNIHKLRP